MTRGVQKASKVNATRNREVPYADPGVSEYAWVTKMLGNGRLTVRCGNKTERLGIIRGNMRKRDWISPGDLVLIALREFQADKVDVIFKYSESEARMLKKYGEIKDDAQDDEEGHEIVFEDDVSAI